MSFMDVIVGIGMYLCSLAFFLVVASGSLQYHIAITKATTENIESFLKTLHFPLTVYRYYPYQKLDDFQKSSRVAGTINRLIGFLFTTVPLLIIVSKLNGALKAQNNTTLIILYIFWIILYCVTLFYALRFGQKLKQFSNPILHT